MSTSRRYYIVAVSSMEQIIGAGLSTVVGVMLPMIKLITSNGVPSWLEGLIGAIGLVGIGVGSAVIGKLSDKQGYLQWFRACPVLIMLGALMCLPGNIPLLVAGLFICGLGTGGGYSLDSAYISELLPPKFRQAMVGLAKATCSLGFIGVAAVCWYLLRHHPNPHLWPSLMWVIFALGAVTLLMRIHWAQSPEWLLLRGKKEQARDAMNILMGKSAALPEVPASHPASNPGWSVLFNRQNIRATIYSGIPWACEGLGVYGFGVFLPILIMALGLEPTGLKGMEQVVSSVKMTALVNFFILPGFVIGLWMLGKYKSSHMLWGGFVLSAIGLILLYLGYTFHWGKASLMIGFVIFEMALNGGPHLITYIIPSVVYPVEIRGAGSGFAALMGKVGAVVGVVVMPLLLNAGGVGLVLIVSAAVMLLGALITVLFQPRNA